MIVWCVNCRNQEVLMYHDVNRWKEYSSTGYCMRNYQREETEQMAINVVMT